MEVIRNNILVVGIVIAIMGVIAVMFRREGFTITERKGEPCKPLISVPDEYLMPNSAALVISGYVYSATPNIYRDGQKIVPLRYYQDYRLMTYYYEVAAPVGLCGSEWVIETSELVEPVVYDGRTNKRLNIDLKLRAENANLWSMKC